MKIIGYQKDFFDQLVYTYGIDETLRLDRSIFVPKGDYQQVFKNGKWIEKFPKDYPFVKELSKLKPTDNGFFDHIDLFKRNNDSEYKNLLWDLRYNWRSGHSKSLFYFDGFIYLLYYKPIVKPKTKFIFYDQTVDLDAETVYTDYKGYLNLLCDETGRAIKVKATDDVIEFSKKFKMPYFNIRYNFFFPFLAIKDFEKHFEPVDVYQKIENFLLTCEIEKMDEQSNDNKITAHGFDLKKSFRKSKNG